MHPNHHTDADTVSVSFDYNTLPEDDREPARHAAGIVRERLANSTKNILEAGSQLLAMKARLRHGAFEDWLRTEVNLEPRSAQRFMRVAQRFSAKGDIVPLLPVTALYELAAPSVSDEVIDSVVERAREGCPPSLKEIKEMKKSRPSAAKDLHAPCADAAPSRSGAADVATPRMDSEDDSAEQRAAACAAEDRAAVGATGEGATTARQTPCFAPDRTGSATSSGCGTLTTRAKADPDPLQKEAEESPRTPEELELARLVAEICALDPKFRQDILEKMINQAQRLLDKSYEIVNNKSKKEASSGPGDGDPRAV